MALTKEYVTFVENGGDIKELTQRVIDRCQYSEGFLDNLETLMSLHEEPFEVEETESGRFRSLKSKFN